MRKYRSSLNRASIVAAVSVLLLVPLRMSAQCSASAWGNSPSTTCGNVGIGTTSAAAPNSFFVGGRTLQIFDAGNLPNIRFNGASSNDVSVGADSAAGYFVNATAGGLLRFYTTSATSPVLRMTIDSSGNVGIGTGTSAIARTLSVVGTVGWYSPTNCNQMGALSNTAADSGQMNLLSGGVSKAFITTSGSSYLNGGNVGIGTTSPSPVPFFASGTTLHIADAAGNLPNIHFTGTSSNDFSIGVDASAAYFYNATAGGLLRFYTNPATQSLPRMTIDAAGNVGIGTGVGTVGKPLEVATSTTNTVFGTDNGTPLIRLTNASATPNNFTGLDFWDGAADAAVIHATFLRNSHNGTLGFATRNAAGTLVDRMTLDDCGNLNVTGSITGASVINAVYQDIAEWVPGSKDLLPGTVVVLDPQKANQVMASMKPYDTSVAGVVSAQPGVILGRGDDMKTKVATVGRVKVRVDASKRAVRIGDLLVTSDIPGMAMVSEPVIVDGVKMHRPGTLIGKALEPLADGKGEVLTLLSLQ